MTIIINGESINYTLEEEKNAGDIFHGISSWLQEGGMLVGGLEINDEAMPLGDDGWKINPIETIETFSIEALSIREGRIRQLETAKDYFILLSNALKSGDESAYRELQSGFEDLKQILPHLLNEGPNPSILPRLEDAMQKNPGTDGSITESEAIQIAAVLESRRKEAENPEEEAESAARVLAQMADSLDDVAVQLQTGRDKAAMDTIIKLSESLQSFTRALSWIESPGAVEEIINDMNGILSELEEALIASDTVLIGDLLEYEIKPRLVELPSSLENSRRSSS